MMSLNKLQDKPLLTSSTKNPKPKT